MTVLANNLFDIRTVVVIPRDVLLVAVKADTMKGIFRVAIFPFFGFAAGCSKLVIAFFSANMLSRGIQRPSASQRRRSSLVAQDAHKMWASLY